jgi:transcriptional regulator with XRE-family HTH domain
MISKIERCEASPTAASLVRIAGAFDLTLGGFLARAEEPRERIVRGADQARWRDPATGYVRRQIFERPDHPLELVRVELPAGTRVGMPASSYARIRQLVWVMEGRLIVEEGTSPLESQQIRRLPTSRRKRASISSRSQGPRP